MAITILGLGPGDPELLTLQAQKMLAQTTEIYLRTARHPTVGGLPPHLVVHSFDDLYETESSFEVVYRRIAERILELGRRPEGVLYAVPGHPLVGEATYRAIRALADEAGVPVRIVAGLSFLEPVFSALDLDPLDAGLQIVDALDPRFDPSLPALICQVYSRAVAAGLKTLLLDRYPAEHPVTVVQAAGSPEQRRMEIPLYALDRRDDHDHLTCIYLPALDWEQNLGDFDTLKMIVARLRSPTGCPWDRAQTHQTLKDHLLEETYEALEALDANDPEALAEELGDLLLQVVLHAQIAEESDEFDIADVIGGIGAKLVRRHPHVFGDVRAETAEQVLANWEQIKRSERAGRAEVTSMLAGVPKSMPSLAYAQTVQKRAARVGFDWQAFRDVLAKVAEEADELADAKTDDERLHEYGDLLFSLVAAARWLDVDAEEALRLANRRFYERFSRLEEMAGARGQALSEIPASELLAMWEEAKRRG